MEPRFKPSDKVFAKVSETSTDCECCKTRIYYKINYAEFSVRTVRTTYRENKDPVVRYEIENDDSEITCYDGHVFASEEELCKKFPRAVNPPCPRLCPECEETLSENYITIEEFADLSPALMDEPTKEKWIAAAHAELEIRKVNKWRRTS